MILLYSEKSRQVLPIKSHVDCKISTTLTSQVPDAFARSIGDGSPLMG